MPDKPLKLYLVEFWTLPLDKVYVAITMPDGCRWAVPAKAIVRCAMAYYEKHGWDDEDDPEYSGTQPMGEELEGILWANADLCQECREVCWDDVMTEAIHISGPRTVPPDLHDCCWWFEEHGGEFELVTTLRVQKAQPVTLWTRTRAGIKGSITAKPMPPPEVKVAHA